VAIAIFTVEGIVIHGFHISMMQESVKWLSIIAIYTLAVTISNRGFGDNLLRFSKAALLIVGALVFLLGHARVTFSLQLDGRYAGTFSHSNAASTFIGVAIITFLIIDKKPNSFAKIFCLSMLFGALFSTGSLGGATSVICSIVVWYAIKREGIFSAASIASVIAAAGYLFVTNFTNLGNKISFINGEDLGGAANSLVATNSGQWRVINWKLLLDRWAESPILGHGLGSTSEVVAPLGAPPHSMIIQLLVETGLVGSLTVLILFFRYAALLFKSRRLESSPKAIVLVAFILVAGFQSNLLLYTPTMYFLAVLFGLLKRDLQMEKIDGKRADI
jgi:O-antigen ligase